MAKDAPDPTLVTALEWLVRLRDDKASDADRRAFQRWLAQDAAHAAAWTKAEGLWRRFDVVEPEIARLRRSQAAMSRRRALAVGGAALIGAGGIYALGRGDLMADVVTDVGERRTLVLADGSSVELGSHSALSVDVTDRGRDLRLFRGEGYFDVAADAGRPFRVHAAGGSIQALGTRFDVKHVDGLVTVAVAEHAVAVRAADAPAAIRVGQGWQVSYGRDGLGGLVRADLEAVEAWRQDRMVFQDVPLRRVLVEIERYRRGRILLLSGAIGAIPVTAVFDTRQPDDALQTIADTLPVRVLRATERIALVYPAW
ncbi:FecR family protein [Blastochloris sulfoviridis]|uniref:DUF4880 domain-containing protein n=1 Tax=Blastochloris sulfoviridis TaxID=50712 RepID=A0A5M6I515_9HYPH|nr:FecR domain-containing protein [Blastochloris sulfoviridis]KAA5602868.1 DUF4880 domain-containing protein [Blastochloris sulfoviridis]